MHTALLCVAIFCSSTLSFEQNQLNPLSDEFIAEINSKQSLWKAGRNFHSDTPLSVLRKLTGVLPKKDGLPTLPLKEFPYVATDIPEFFDAREQWPECADIIGTIFDQSGCGSCWAFASTEVMSDRICIKSNGEKKVYVSAEDLAFCCDSCSSKGGCLGGSPEYAYYYWNHTGIVTGGWYQSKYGCKSYTFPPCSLIINSTSRECKFEKSPACIKKCDESYDKEYESDKTFGSGFSVVGEKNIQKEILDNGPVTAACMVYDDLCSYKTGVYKHVSGQFVNRHAVKILGWGVENGIPYWLVANSWNTTWGDKGYFKILRGSNECEIEERVIAGTPNL